MKEEQTKPVRVELHMPPALLAEVDAEAEKEGVSRAEYLRVAIENELAEATVPEMLARLEDKLDAMWARVRPDAATGYRMALKPSLAWTQSDQMILGVTRTATGSSP